MDWPTTSTIDPVYLNQLMAQQEAERAVEERSGIDEIVLQEERTSGWQRLKQRALSTVAGLAFTAASLLPVQAAEPLAEPQILTVVPFAGGSGANGSQWYGSVRIDNTSVTETADGTVYVLPQQENVLAASPQFEYSIGPGQSLIIDNLADYFAGIGDPQPNHGNVSVLVEPSDYVPVGALALIKNVHNLTEDNASIQTPGNTNVTTTDLLQGLPGISQTELLSPGDYVTIGAPSVQEQEYDDPVRTKPMHRMNLFAYGEQDDLGNDPELMCELIRADGTRETTRWFDLHTNGGVQLNNVIENGFQRTPLGEENIRCVVMNGKAWILPSVVKNNVDLPGVDDGYTTTPTITRLVETASYTASPDQLEANDPAVLRASITSQPGSVITGATVDGAIQTYINGNTTNQLTWSHSDTPTTPGTYTNTLSFAVHTNDGEFPRTVQGNNIEISAEQDHDFLATDVNPIIQSRKAEIARLLAKGVYTGDATQYGPSVWEEALDMYQDGVNTTNNMEAETYRINDTSDPNQFIIMGIDGRSESVAWYYERDIDQLRTILSGE